MSYGMTRGREERNAPKGELLRQGDMRDYLALLWLLETSHWTYQFRGCENLFELLAHEPSALWLRKETIRAAMLSSLYRSPVATGRVLALRDLPDMQSTFDLLLPYAEACLAGQGARWMSFTNGPDWLLNGLATHGYRLQDRVIVYSKRDWQAGREGNREVKVRQATPEDLAPIIALDAEVFEPFWQLNPAIVQHAISNSAYLLVAESEQSMTGYLLAERQGDEAHIGRIGVAPKYQRQGIGTRLMAEAFALMRNDGLETAYLNTQEDNLPSRALYEGLGFQLTGESDVIWAKPLLAAPDRKY